MEQSIQEFKSSGLLKAERGDGFVFGALRNLGAGRAVLDVERCKRLVLAARPFKTVFHRAFDEMVGSYNPGTESDARAPEWEATLRDLVGYGFDGILTSGGPGNAIQNADVLERIQEKAGDGIEIIVGGGVRSSSVQKLALQLKLQEKKGRAWVHSSCLTTTGSEQVDVKEVRDILTQLV
jgi:copper homeostasis protein